jgi:alkylation response protein AidB-like acyl-CoA dehydrogenase
MSKSYFLDEDIQFHFNNTVNWKKIVPLYEELDDNFTLEQAVKMYYDTLKELGLIAVGELEETAQDSDKTGAKLEGGTVVYPEGFVRGLKAYQNAGALALNVKREYEGAGMPGIVCMMNLEMMSKADPAFMTVYAFYAAVARTLEAFGSRELKEEYIPKLVKGQYCGSMSLTESDAGSDLGQIRTTAENMGDHWEITGSKIFITNGNGDVTLVLARSARGETGTKGLSMFLVPRFMEKDGSRLENFKLESLEHKLGINGSPTCELSFNNSTGYLVGKEGEGLKQMFYLMNEARLGVAVQALGIASKAYEEAKEYAAERVQFGKPIIRHELIADKLLDMETDIRAMRCMIYKASEYNDLKEGYREKSIESESKGNNTEDERKYRRYSYLAREMVPLVKYFATEKSIQIARDNIQIHGGSGYTRDLPAEMHLRDSVITTIYEGTSQMQALMALGDTLKRSKVLPYLEPFRNIVKRFGQLFKSYEKRKALGAEICFNRAVDYLKRPFTIARIRKNGRLKEKALAYAKLNAERLIRLKAYKTAIDIAAGQSRLSRERKQFARRFIRNYYPEVKRESRIITSGDRSTLKYNKEE